MAEQMMQEMNQRLAQLEAMVNAGQAREAELMNALQRMATQRGADGGGAATSQPTSSSRTPLVDTRLLGKVKEFDGKDSGWHDWSFKWKSTCTP